MGRRNRPAHAGSDEKPDGGTEERGHHDVYELHRVQTVDGVQVNDAGAHGIRHLATGENGAGDLEDGRNSKGLFHGQRAGTHGGAEGVGDVIATDVEGHEKGEDNGSDQKDAVGAFGNLAVAPNDKEDESYGGENAEEQVPNPISVLSVHGLEVRHRRCGGAQNVGPF